MLRTVLIALALSAEPAHVEVSGTPPAQLPIVKTAPVQVTPPTLHWFHPARSPCPAIPYEPTDNASLLSARSACNSTQQAQAWGACVSKQGPAVPSC